MKVGIKMKHRLYKFAALAETAVLIVTMGACSVNVKTGESAKTPTTTKERETIAFSIFDDPNTLSSEGYTELWTKTEVEKTTKITEIETPTNDIREETITKEEITKPYENIASRFSSQEELENYLTELYESSGKNCQEIINEYNEKQSEDYYIYREDLYTAAAYMSIIENGYTLNDVALELDYLLTARMNPCEITDADIEALKTLIAISGYEDEKVPYMFQLYEQLALERHKVACINKSEHVEGNKFIECEHLNLETLYQAIIANREQTLSLEKF